MTTEQRERTATQALQGREKVFFFPFLFFLLSLSPSLFACLSISLSSSPFIMSVNLARKEEEGTKNTKSPCHVVPVPATTEQKESCTHGVIKKAQRADTLSLSLSLSLSTGNCNE